MCESRHPTHSLTVPTWRFAAHADGGGDAVRSTVFFGVLVDAFRHESRMRANVGRVAPGEPKVAAPRCACNTEHYVMHNHDVGCEAALWLAMERGEGSFLFVLRVSSEA
jgi:hypothetical protein